MHLSREQIKTFIALFKNRFNKEIGYDEALEKGIKLVRLMELVYKPMTEEDYKKLQERRQETGDLKP